MNWFTEIMISSLNFFYALTGNYGLAIIFLTITINIALYPLTLSSMIQMAAMQKVQPKIAEMQKKYKDQPDKMQKELMEVYKKEKVNPFGGCLPMLLKIPFFIALFFALQSQGFINEISSPEKNSSFLWISGRISESKFAIKKTAKELENNQILLLDKQKSKEKGEKIFVWSPKSNINEAGLMEEIKNAKIEDKSIIEDAKKSWSTTTSLARPDPYYILIILIAITTYLMQKLMPAGASQQAAGMNYVMPVFIAIISVAFPSGVQIYWIMSNLVGILQQGYIMKMIGEKGKNVSRETF